MKKAAVVFGLLMASFVLKPDLWSQDKDRAELAKAVAGAKVSLEQGLSASAHEGKPISAKFEIEDGKLQLSVYTVKGDKFSEVVVDHNMGKAAKTEAITSGEDLSAAKTQNEAMAKANSRYSRQSPEGQPGISSGEHLFHTQGRPSDRGGHPHKGR